MFKRLNFDLWQDVLPVLAFIVTFVVFLLVLARAIRMSHDQAEHLAHLPLDPEPRTPNDHE